MRVKLELTITSGNAAFQDGMHSLEVARILRAITEVIREGAEGMYDLRDVNGAWAGRATFEAVEEDE